VGAIAHPWVSFRSGPESGIQSTTVDTVLKEGLSEWVDGSFSDVGSRFMSLQFLCT